MKDVVVEIFDNKVPINYPDLEQVGSLSRQPSDITDGDRSFSHHVKEYPGFDIHHVETLTPEIHYIRGLIDDKDAPGRRYVFSLKVNLNTFGHEDFKEVLDDVVQFIKTNKRLDKEK